MIMKQMRLGMWVLAFDYAVKETSERETLNTPFASMFDYVLAWNLLDGNLDSVGQDFHLIVVNGGVFLKTHGYGDNVIGFDAGWGFHRLLKEKNLGVDSLGHLLFQLDLVSGSGKRDMAVYLQLVLMEGGGPI
jgi:hypothetical protein